MQSVWALVSLYPGLIKADPLLYKYTYFKRQFTVRTEKYENIRQL
jgi:hypothetical protein